MENADITLLYINANIHTDSHIPPQSQTHTRRWVTDSASLVGKTCLHSKAIILTLPPEVGYTAWCCAPGAPLQVLRSRPRINKINRINLKQPFLEVGSRAWYSARSARNYFHFTEMEATAWCYASVAPIPVPPPQNQSNQSMAITSNEQTIIFTLR